MQRNACRLKDTLYFLKYALIVLDVLEDLIRDYIVERLIVKWNPVRHFLQGLDPLARVIEFASKITAIGIQPGVHKCLDKLSLSAPKVEDDTRSAYRSTAIRKE